MDKTFLFLVTIVITANYVQLKNQFCNSLVSSKYGLIQGNTRLVNGRFVEEFLGIKYAQAVQRFMPSQVIRTPWNGLYDAKKFGPSCLQIGRGYMSEDCLYLNIWRPWFYWIPQVNRLVPVLCYVYGSAYYKSSAATVRGDLLSVQQDIIVVSFNYRLGSFGFAYGDDNLMPGNSGLTDVISALQWIQDNIRDFGGDPNQVTLAGHSSGSMMISLLPALPSLPKGLFSKLVLFSGTALTSMHIEPKSVGLEKTKLLALKVGCGPLRPGPLSSQVINCLRTTNASRLARYDAANDIRALGGSDRRSYLPVYGTKLIPKPLIKLITDSRRKHSVQMIIWIAQDEQGRYFPNKTFSGLKDAYEFAYSRLAFVKKNLTLIEFEQFFNHYVAKVDPLNQTDIRNHVFNFYNDFSSRCPAILLSEAYSVHNEVYATEFRYVIDKHGHSQRPGGPWHDDILELIFGDPVRRKSGYSCRDKRMSQRLMRLVGQTVCDNYDLSDWPPIYFDYHHPERNPVVKFIDYQNHYVIYEKQSICLKWGKLLGYDLSSAHR